MVLTKLWSAKTEHWTVSETGVSVKIYWDGAQVLTVPRREHLADLLTALQEFMEAGKA